MLGRRVTVSLKKMKKVQWALSPEELGFLLLGLPAGERYWDVSLAGKKSFPVVSVSPDDVKRTPFWCGGTLLSKLPSAASMRVNKCWVWVIFISEWDVSRTSATQHPLLSWGMKLTPLLGFKTSSSSYHFWSAALVWLWHHFLGLLLSLVRSRRNQKSMTFCWKQKFQCAFFILIRHLIQLWSRMTFASNILWSEIDCN